MLKPILAVMLAFCSVKMCCKATCPLTPGTDIPPTENILQMNGTWTEYKKTKSFLTNETCITYDIICPSDTSCTVNIVQDKKILNTTTLTKNGESIAWGEKDPFYLHVDPKIGYAILWDCKGETTKTYEIGVLMVNISNGIKEVDAVVNKINVTHGGLNAVNYSTCSGTTLIVNLATLILTLLIVAIKS